MEAISTNEEDKAKDEKASHQLQEDAKILD